MKSKCKHTYITYLGEQETSVKNVYLKLYNCLKCHTTLVYTENSKLEIVDTSPHHKHSVVY
ncbi:hypothetical protein ACFL50_04395 [Candidatus Latescibacterota bacterium]